VWRDQKSSAYSTVEAAAAAACQARDVAAAAATIECRPQARPQDRQPGGRRVDHRFHHPMTTRLFDRAQQRDPIHRRRWIVLVDGNNHQPPGMAA